MSPQKSKNRHKFTISTHINKANICKYVQNFNLKEHLKNKQNKSIHPLNQPPAAPYTTSWQLRCNWPKWLHLKVLHWRDWKPTDFLEAEATVGVAKQPTYQQQGYKPKPNFRDQNQTVGFCWLFVGCWGVWKFYLLSSSWLGCTVLKKKEVVTVNSEG